MQARGAPFKEPEVILICRQLCAALSHLHSRGVVHRDVKPANVLLTYNKSVLLSDFGLCSICPAKKDVFRTLWLRTLCGTPECSPPEIHLKQAYRGPPVDVWALGVLALFLLLGQQPFSGINRGHVSKRVTRGIFVQPSNASTECSEMLGEMLQLDPSLRPPASKLVAHRWLATPNSPAQAVPQVQQRESEVQPLCAEPVVLPEVVPFRAIQDAVISPRRRQSQCGIQEVELGDEEIYAATKAEVCKPEYSMFERLSIAQSLRSSDKALTCTEHNH